jgi:hypothetical protein
MVGMFCISMFKLGKLTYSLQDTWGSDNLELISRLKKITQDISLFFRF